MAELTLHNGDCLEIMKAIPDKSVDLIICDLPYGCLIGGAGKEKKKRNLIRYVEGEPTQNTAVYNGGVIAGCAWDIKINLEEFWKQVKRIRKSDHSPTIHFCTTKFGYEVIKSNPDEFRYDLVWDKQRGVSFLSANKMPMRSHEMIYIFSKVGAYYERKDIAGDFQSYKFKGTDTPPAFNGSKGLKGRTATENDGTKRCVLSVIQTPNKTLRKSSHPTEKPEALYRWLIERYCPADGMVLDPTFGSGNSVFTAFALGRSAIGIEKDEKFFKKAEERLEALP
jgi:site-specific DNA-methyltransferase (adenine-specific)